MNSSTNSSTNSSMNTKWNRRWAMRAAAAATAVTVAIGGMNVGVLFAQDAESTAEPAAQAEASAAATPYLGIAVVQANDQVVIIRVQPGSPADAADLNVGDVLVSINGAAVETAEAVSEQVAALAVGDTVTVEVSRNNETVSADVVLASAPVRGDGHGSGRGGFGGFGNPDDLAALPTDPLTAAELLLRADLEATEAGYSVVAVGGRNPLELAVGDVITAVNGQAIAELDLETLFADLAAATDPQIEITSTRDGEEATITQAIQFGRGGMSDGMPGGMGGPPRGGMGHGMGGQFGGRPDGFAPNDLPFGQSQPPVDVPDAAPEIDPEATPEAGSASI